MAKLNEKQRADAKSLLEDCENICGMLADVDRRIFQLFLTSNKEGDDTDFCEVQISRKTAKAALQEEKAWTETELKKLGIEV